MKKRILLGLTLAELKDLVRSLGMPAFTGSQIAKWLYERHVTSIEEMTNLSKANRAHLAEVCKIGNAAPIDAQHSKDGTIKYLFPVQTQAKVAFTEEENNPNISEKPTKFVETVYIPEENGHATLCVSCEVGCKMNCLFCQTGKQGFDGYLTAADILNQVYSLPEVDKLTNIVFMGQGEPMDNLDNVLRATEILTAEYGWAWSPKRITVSSVGIKDKLKRFLEESDCQVAISLHSPIHEVIDLLGNYDFAHQRRLTFEYIVFGGVNDSTVHAKEICRLLKGLDCHINLIRFHRIPDVALQGADEKKMESFRDYLTAHGFYTTIRASRGQDIFAACGLLSTDRKIKQLRGK